MSDLDDLESGNYHFAWKLVVLGDTGVGKTTLLKHHVQDDGALLLWLNCNATCGSACTIDGCEIGEEVAAQQCVDDGVEYTPGG